MTTLVTGGTGFLGRHLVRQLVADGQEVVVLARQVDLDLADHGVQFVEGSLSSADDVRKAVAGVQRVYHCAGLVERDPKHAHRMYELHVDGTRRLLDALRQSDVQKIVVASTSGTVGVSTDPEFIADESSPVAEHLVRHWPYYLSKIYQERVCDRYRADYGLPIVTMRPTLLLGPGDTRESSTGDVVRFMRKKIPTAVSGGLSFVDARDAAIAFRLAMEKAEPGSTYLLGATNMTLSGFFKALEDITGIKGPRIPMPKEAAVTGAKLLDAAFKVFGQRAAIDPVSVEMGAHFWYINSDKAQRELGWTPRDAQVTLRDTVRWIEQYHPSFADHLERPTPPENWVPRETLEWAEARREQRLS
jgi:dihydroflavonol-4-reductase